MGRRKQVNDMTFNYPRVWIVLQNDMILRVLNNKDAADKFIKRKSAEYLEQALRGNYPHARFWISEEPVFDA